MNLFFTIFFLKKIDLKEQNTYEILLGKSPYQQGRQAGPFEVFNLCDGPKYLKRERKGKGGNGISLSSFGKRKKKVLNRDSL